MGMRGATGILGTGHAMLDVERPLYRFLQAPHQHTTADEISMDAAGAKRLP